MPLITRLIRPVARSAALNLYVPVVAVAVALGWIASRQPADAGVRLFQARVLALALGIVSAFLYDDAAKLLTDPAPNRLWIRRLIRTLLGLLICSAILGLFLSIASRDMDVVWVLPSAESPVEIDLSPFPAGRVILETAALVSLALAAAATLAHWSAAEPGRIATSILLSVYLVTWMLPLSIRPWAAPIDERWSSVAHWLWVSIGVCAVVVVVFSWDSRHRARIGLPGREALNLSAEQ